MGSSEQWYAIQVRPRFEKSVHQQLAEKGYETFLPMFSVTRSWSDRVKTISLPVFPCYLFCRLDVCARLPVLVTPGVLSIVGSGKTPTPVDAGEIHSIRRVLESGLQTQPWPYLRLGQGVRVESGPLEGLMGIVIREKAQDRLVVSVSLLMRSVAVEIDRSRVKSVEVAESTILARPHRAGTRPRLSR